MGGVIGGPERIRTFGLCLRRAALYPAELRVRLGPAIRQSDLACKRFVVLCGVCARGYANRSWQSSSASTKASTSAVVLYIANDARQVAETPRCSINGPAQ